MKFTVLTASRGRAKWYAEMVESAKSLAKNPENVEFIVGVDTDDPTKAEYQGIAKVVEFVGKRSVPIIMNTLAMEHATGDILMGPADRSLFKTQDWDELLEKEIGGKVGMVWPNNGDSRHKCTMWAMSRPYMEAVGCFLDTRFEHFYADNVVGIVAELSGKGRYLHEFIILQRHVTFGTAPRDKTYEERRQKDKDGSSINSRDAEKFFAMENEMKAMAEKLANCH